MITQKRLKELLHYCPDTGVFTRRVRTSNSVVVGGEAGHVCKRSGYRLISVDDVLHRAHRLAWLYVFGSFPDNQLDHISRNRSDNRLANLREATNAQNCQNTRLRKDNTSRAKGVHWYKARRKWQVYINLNGKRSFLGYFSEKAEAIAAYVSASQQLHPYGEHANA